MNLVDLLGLTWYPSDYNGVLMPGDKYNDAYGNVFTMLSDGSIVFAGTIETAYTHNGIATEDGMLALATPEMPIVSKTLGVIGDFFGNAAKDLLDWLGLGKPKCFKVTPPKGDFGSTDFGNAMHENVADAFRKQFPDVEFQFSVKPGQRGVDIVVPDEDVGEVGFKYGEIKPNTASGQNTFNKQVQNWLNNGTIPQGSVVQPITYDANGSIGFGFNN